jgi:site-specific DNA recombinase
MKLKVNEIEAARVRKIFKLYLEHQALLSTVAELERRGWKTKRWTTRKGKQRGGRQFDKGCLYSLLTNVTYLGKTRYKEEIHEGEHAAIVEPEVWKQVQTMLVRNGQLGGSGVRNKSGALLKGLLRCAACDCSMSPTHTTRNGNKRYRYYVCLTAQKRGWQNCPSRSVPAGEIEKYVIDQIKCIGQDPELIAETLRQCQRQAEERIGELTSESSQLERELNGLHREIQLLLKEADGRTTGIATVKLADLQEQIQAAEHRLTESREEIIALEKSKIDEQEVAHGLADFEQVWSLLSLREQERLLKLIVARVDYDGRDETISLSFHPTGIKTLHEQT